MAFTNNGLYLNMMQIIGRARFGNALTSSCTFTDIGLTPLADGEAPVMFAAVNAALNVADLSLMINSAYFVASAAKYAFTQLTSDQRNVITGNTQGLSGAAAERLISNGLIPLLNAANPNALSADAFEAWCGRTKTRMIAQSKL